MSRRLRAAGVLAGLAALAVFAAGCGSSGSNDSSAKSPASGSGAASHANWPKQLTIGAIPAENAAATIASLTPIKKLLQAKLGIPVKITTGTSYSALIEAQKAGTVDVVEYGPFSYYIANNQGVGLENVGIVINSKGTDGGYHSLGLTNPKNAASIKSIKDFAGKKICFVDPASTSGFLYPSYGLLKAGINPQTGVKPTFAGAHDASVLAIAKGTCDAGFAEDIMPPQLEKAGKLKASDIVQVWKSPEIPGSPISASTKLPADLRAQLKTLFVRDANAEQLTAMGYCSSADQCAKTLGFYGFADPSVANYGVIKQVCDTTKSSSCTSVK